MLPLVARLLNTGFIDLGTGLGNNTPEVHDVDRGQVPAKTFEFVSALVDFSRYSAMTPTVAFGEDEGSQRSRMTLVLRMWPMLQTAKANRTLIRSGLSRLAEKTFAIARGQGITITTGGRCCHATANSRCWRFPLFGGTLRTR